jgi:O-antigen/teichoic acid export membrane protein
MSEQWSNFFVMVGGGAAALAGLIFVAMSINHAIIIRNATHKNRAINMLTGFTAVFMASSFALIGNQSLTALGFEWLFLWLTATAIFIRGLCHCYSIRDELDWTHPLATRGRHDLLSRRGCGSDLSD